MNQLVTQFVRSALQFVWAWLGAVGFGEVVERIVNVESLEAWLIAVVSAAVLAGLQWLERRFPVLGRLFGFARTPVY